MDLHDFRERGLHLADQKPEDNLAELLAIINGDGGHLQAYTDTVVAQLLAERRIYWMMERIDELENTNNILKYNLSQATENK